MKSIPYEDPGRLPQRVLLGLSPEAQRYFQRMPKASPHDRQVDRCSSNSKRYLPHRPIKTSYGPKRLREPCETTGPSAGGHDPFTLHHEPSLTTFGYDDPTGSGGTLDVGLWLTKSLWPRGRERNRSDRQERTQRDRVPFHNYSEPGGRLKEVIARFRH